MGSARDGAIDDQRRVSLCRSRYQVAAGVHHWHNGAVRTSFARFIAETSIACRWPKEAPPANRRELERVFAECVSDVSHEMESLVERFLDDPMLKSSPLEQLLAYSLAMRECATKVRAIATVLEGASQDLSARADRSMLVVGQSGRPASEAAGGPKRF